jgi:hypothetical protein
VAEINIPTGPLAQPPNRAIVPAEGENWAEVNQQALLQVFNDVELGEHDRDIIAGLSQWEPWRVATICSWILRARGAATEGKVVLDEPNEIGLTWPDGSDMLTVTQYGLTLHVDGEPWHLSAAEAREIAAHLAAGADAVDAVDWSDVARGDS